MYEFILESSSDVIGILFIILINDKMNIIVSIGIDNGSSINLNVCYGVVLFKVVVFFSEWLMVLKYFLIV